MIIQSIKPATLHIQFKPILKCDCYLLLGLESDQDAECKGKYIKSHQKQTKCWFYIRKYEDLSLYKPLRLRKKQSIVNIKLQEELNKQLESKNSDTEIFRFKTA